VLVLRTLIEAGVLLALLLAHLERLRFGNFVHTLICVILNPQEACTGEM